MEETLKFIELKELDTGDILIATPFPKTEFWNYALSKKLVSNAMDWSRLRIWHTHHLPENEDFILLTDRVTKKEFMKMFRRITDVLIEKQRQYNNNAEIHRLQAIGAGEIFAAQTLKKALRSPGKAMRYLFKFIYMIIKRIFFCSKTVQKK